MDDDWEALEDEILAQIDHSHKLRERWQAERQRALKAEAERAQAQALAERALQALAEIRDLVPTKEFGDTPMEAVLDLGVRMVRIAGIVGGVLNSQAAKTAIEEATRQQRQ